MTGKKKLKAVSFLFLALAFGNIALSAGDKTYNTKPYDFAASEIMRNKIVLLAENGALGHYNMFPYITFINVIKSWNTKANEGNLHNKTLAFIVEKSPLAVKLIQHYIDNDDLNPLLDKMWSTSSLEELYLFYKLKGLNKEIKDSGNELKIIGFEADERFENEYYFKKTEEERNIFIARDRDSLIFENINSYVKSNPEDYILITYGNAHLEEERVSKMPGQAGTNDEKGYYLAYYLRREFGSRLLTIDQTYIDDDNFNYGDRLNYLKDKSFLVKKGDELFAGKVPFSELKADYTIIRHDGLAGPRFVRYVFSRNNLIRNYNNLLEYEGLCGKYNKALSMNFSEVKSPAIASSLRSVKLITGMEFRSVKDFKSYLDSTGSNFFHERILKDEISIELFKYLKNNPQDPEFRLMLYSIGFAPWYTALSFVPKEEDWKTNDWTTALEYFIYFDYVGLYWFGTKMEKEKAKNFLLDFTKRDFAHAAEYLEWYYKSNFEYNFDSN